jgi:hypothetical protein
MLHQPMRHREVTRFFFFFCLPKHASAGATCAGGFPWETIRVQVLVPAGSRQYSCRTCSDYASSMGLVRRDFSGEVTQESQSVPESRRLSVPPKLRCSFGFASNSLSSNDVSVYGSRCALASRRTAWKPALPYRIDCNVVDP